MIFIGKRPYNSGIISVGLFIVKAPAAINKIFLVSTKPFLVYIMHPSNKANKSL